MIMARLNITPFASPMHSTVSGAHINDISFFAWVAQAEPGEALVYHRGFLAVDTFGSASPLSPERRSTLRRTADAALRAAEQDLVHLVQARIGPDQFAYIAVARRKPHKAGASLSMRLLEAA
jgi:hypothetical protein